MAAEYLKNIAREFRERREKEAKEVLAARSKTPHQQRVENFMYKAGQEIPNEPTVPSDEVRLLRAKLVFEEAVKELIFEGLAVDIEVSDQYGHMYRFSADNTDQLRFTVSAVRKPDLKLIADGCADTSVVTVGTLSACGIADVELLHEVDSANLRKFEVPKCPVHGSTMTMTNTPGTYQCPTYVGPTGKGTVTDHSIGDRCQYFNLGPYKSPEGKWVKSPDFKGPDIGKVLKRQILPGQEEKNKQFAEAYGVVGPPGEGPDGTFSPLEQRVAVLESELKRIDRNLFQYAEENTNCLKAIVQAVNELKPAPGDWQERDKIPAGRKETAAKFDSGGIELCPHCKNPLSDEMLRKMRAMQKKGVESTGTCPECKKTFIIEDLSSAKTANEQQRDN